MPPVLGDFDAAMTTRLRDRWRHHYPSVQPDFGLLSIPGAGDGCDRSRRRRSHCLLRPDLPADLTSRIRVGSNNDVQVARLKQGK